MTSFTLNLISVKVSFHDIFKKTLNITPVNITSFTVTVFVGPFSRSISMHDPCASALDTAVKDFELSKNQHLFLVYKILQ